MPSVMDIYWSLLEQYGWQGWWPVTPTCTSDCKPVYGVSTRTKKQQFEIILGAILTQNTAWDNAEKAIQNLQKHGLVDSNTLERMTAEQIAPHIRSAGYFNQKAKKIKAFLAYKGEITREGLLTIWGLGPETVDSILLYAYKQPAFVVDAYTRRMFEQYRIIKETDRYESIKEYFENKIERSLLSGRRFGNKHAKVDSKVTSEEPTSSIQKINTGEDNELKKELVEIYNEYHALIVAHGKKYYSKKPYGRDDFILDLIH